MVTLLIYADKHEAGCFIKASNILATFLPIFCRNLAKKNWGLMKTPASYLSAEINASTDVIRIMENNQ